MNAEKMALIEEYLSRASGIAWDGCHKIYVLMDDEQMADMQRYGYDPLIWADTTTPEVMLITIEEWYEESCGLRFISAVETNHDNPNAGYRDLISQGEGWNEDEDEEEESE